MRLYRTAQSTRNTSTQLKKFSWKKENRRIFLSYLVTSGAICTMIPNGGGGSPSRSITILSFDIGQIAWLLAKVSTSPANSKRALEQVRLVVRASLDRVQVSDEWRFWVL